MKVREEALNYKIKKEKSNIQKLLSSHKISPRTGDVRELELEKWVDKERADIDNYKRMFEENKRRTEEIIKETMGVEGMFSNYELTQETLKKLFADKITTPREGLSLRSGFNSSRRLYELSQINKQINGEDLDQDDEKVKRLISSESVQDSDRDNIVFSNDSDNKPALTLKQKIEAKIKAEQEITFEKNKQNYFIGTDPELDNPSIELLDTFKDKSLIKHNQVDHDDSESPLGILDNDPTKFSSKTPNIFQSDEILPKTPNSPPSRDTSKSLDLSPPKEEATSLIRIKSEHNLKEEENKNKKSTNPKKEKTYNSQNFFTEHFDDQGIEDAIQKIKNNPEFEPSPVKNIELAEGETIEDENWDIDLDKTLGRNNETQIKAIIESANKDFKGLVDSNIIGGGSKGAILVNDNADEGLPEESSVSDNMDLTKGVDLKKEGYFKITNKFDKKEGDTTKEESTDMVKLEETKHSKSTEELSEHDQLENSINPISNIDIERIGSPNKPKVAFTEDLKDTRQKIDDDDDEEEGIITGSHIIDNTTANNLIQEMDIGDTVIAKSMVEYFKQSDV